MSLRLFALGPGGGARLCAECFSSLQAWRGAESRALFATRSVREDTCRGRLLPRVLRKGYFSSNGSSIADSAARTIPRWIARRTASSVRHVSIFDSSAPTTLRKRSAPAAKGDKMVEEVPHIGRRRTKSEKNASGGNDISPDASARLSTFSSKLPTTSIKRKLAAYLALTKPRLSFLVVLTATTAYSLYPVPSVLALDPDVAPLPTLSTSTLTFLHLTTGTFLSSACANTLNMLFEPKYDAQMSRTRNRPLVRKLLSPRTAVLFAIGTGVTGVTGLYFGTNPTVAGLSAFNIFLYAFIYTPLKRVSVLNTWVGAIVGGIPPLMGWTAAAGKVATTGHDMWRDLLFGPDSAGGWILASILYAWQFPHFNALSYTIREEYKNAGYKMMAWTNPARNSRVALRYSILMFPLCAGLWWVGVVNDTFLVGGTVVNCWLTREAYRFWRLQGAQGTARGLFWAGVWHLPLLMVGALVSKKGIWDGVWSRAFGTPVDEADEADDDDDDDDDDAPGIGDEHIEFGDGKSKVSTQQASGLRPVAP